ncbi:uncharacterized protein LOC108047011 [Drosophila rhopaloa]|uniref:Uncharacterized protein LOC108047011 n=1 Tax=Drosophila rhopaloa TaxID=1041015 RepID=A0A6P4F569_DRORH|nr:uncharacterized protein LOC108047011 [Drosophila rhopaloa]
MSDTSGSGNASSDTSLEEKNPSDTSLEEKNPSDTSLEEKNPSDTSLEEKNPSDTSVQGESISDTALERESSSISNIAIENALNITVNEVCEALSDFGKPVPLQDLVGYFQAKKEIDDNELVSRSVVYSLKEALFEEEVVRFRGNFSITEKDVIVPSFGSVEHISTKRRNMNHLQMFNNESSGLLMNSDSCDYLPMRNRNMEHLDISNSDISIECETSSEEDEQKSDPSTSTTELEPPSQEDEQKSDSSASIQSMDSVETLEKGTIIQEPSCSSAVKRKPIMLPLKAEKRKANEGYEKAKNAKKPKQELSSSDSE